MISKEKLEEVRQRVNYCYDNSKWIYPQNYYIRRSARDIPTLLNALDALEKEYKQLDVDFVYLQEDRDMYRNRCKALEQAIVKDCSTCLYYEHVESKCSECDFTDPHINWEFDEARFSRKDDKNEN